MAQKTKFKAAIFSPPFFFNAQQKEEKPPGTYVPSGVLRKAKLASESVDRAMQKWLRSQAVSYERQNW